MTFSKKKVARMLYAFGFMHAMEWDSDKLREMAIASVTHYPRQEVPEQYLPLFDDLVKQVESKEFLVWERKPNLNR